MALPGVKDSECQQAEAEDHKLLGPGDYISCQAVRRLYLWAAFNHGFLGSGTVYSCQECHNLRSAPLRRCTAHHVLYPCRVSEILTRLNLSSAQKYGPPGIWQHSDPESHYSGSLEQCTLEHPGTWASWTWEVHEKKSPPGTMLWQNTRPLAPRKSRRCMAQLGLGFQRTLRNLSSLGQGIAGDKEHTWDCALAENWGVWTGWAWEEWDMHGSPGTGPS